ncbi:AfsR/SARP family transcriptional regulator [Paenibacillus silviterrae]|uniref:AfsR/SARP family transcriptional regulator n=1 Tax=Paenibacillus silviterrae TaxID=3242194 RepID=UPI00254351B9|nr:BTAD domain-containing putative transcriptional regulator [Paenibacillus chinjuensis]
MEAAALGHFTTASEYVDLLPLCELKMSPLLLQVYGEKRWLEGKLSLAADALQSSVKGYVRQGLSDRFLSAFATLAIVRTQLGQWHEAETMLAFLDREWELKEMEIKDGRIPLALAVLARSRKDLGLEADRYECAASLFREADLCSLAIYTLAEASLRPKLLLKHPMVKEALLLHARQAGAAECIRMLIDSSAGITVLPAELSKRHWDLLTLQASGTSANPVSEDVEVQYYHALIQYKQLMTQGKESEAVSPASRVLLLRQQLPYEDLHPLDERSSAAPLSQEASSPMLPGGWSIRCFGGLACTSQGAEITHIHWKRRKALELFAYLLLQPGYSAVREVVADVLFPDAEPGKAINQLHVAAHRLRQVLQESLHADRGLYMIDGTLYLDPQLIGEVDVETYRIQVRVAHQLGSDDPDLALELLGKASLLYGPLLPELPYSDWLERCRTQLQELQCGVLSKLAAASIAAGDEEKAKHYWTEWISLAPAQEEAYQQIIRLHLKQGRPAEAEACYRRLEAVLSDELGMTPSVETRRLLQRTTDKGKERHYE